MDVGCPKAKKCKPTGQDSQETVPDTPEIYGDGTVPPLSASSTRACLSVQKDMTAATAASSNGELPGLSLLQPGPSTPARTLQQVQNPDCEAQDADAQDADAEDDSDTWGTFQEAQDPDAWNDDDECDTGKAAPAAAAAAATVSVSAHHRDVGIPTDDVKALLTLIAQISSETGRPLGNLQLLPTSSGGINVCFLLLAKH